MTPEAWGNILKGLGTKLPDLVDTALRAGIDEIDTNLSERIYNKNEDINGVSFGGYSEDYKAYRLSLNLDISKKNLQLSDRMRKTQIKDYDKYELRLSTLPDTAVPPRNSKFKSTGVTQAEKARYQEQQLGMKIFEASEKEKELAVSAIATTFIKEVYNAI